MDYESHATALDRNEVGGLLVAAGLGAAAGHAMISLLALNRGTQRGSPAPRRAGGCVARRPRTTMRYDRARTSLDRHATYIVATYIAGAAR